MFKIVSVNGGDMNPKEKKSFTIQDIAKLTGFSIGTVDRALHHREGIKPETREKILEVAEQVGYRTNRVASALSRKKPLVFAAVFPRELHYFYDDVRRGFQDAIERLKDFRVAPLYKDIETLGSGEEEALSSLLSQEISGVVFAPGHSHRFNHLINNFTQRGIPVVAVSTDAPESKRLTTVCVNPRKNGELAGELMANWVKGEVVILIGSQEIDDHYQKTIGFQKALAQFQPSPQLVAILESQESENRAEENTRKLLKNHPELSGIYIATANSVGVCRTLEESGRAQEIKVIATDLFPEVVHYLKKGVINATIFQNPYRQGFEATMSLFQFLVEGIAPPAYLYLEPVIVMRSNLEFYFPAH